MNPLARWRRMERREAIGEWAGLACVVLLVVWFEFDGLGLAWIDFGLGFSSSWIVLAIGCGLLVLGFLISPPSHWRWGRVPVTIQDPSHEHRVHGAQPLAVPTQKPPKQDP
ncbi:MAG: hypothetical protein JNK75_14360 [Betaproteobacteria bacterium]|nr:hypothetical protein [Betaproteobacteria bacterium]